MGRGTDLVVDLVGYGRPATEALARRIGEARAGGHPLDPVTVVVPSNTAGLSARRLLATGDAADGLAPVNLSNVAFVTPFRLAELHGAGAMGDRRPLTNPVLSAAVRSVLATAPGLFAGVADHQATAAAVVAVYAELSRATVATRAAIAGASPRGSEVVRVVEAVRARLTGFYDEDDLARAAAARVGDVGALIWHLPDRLTPAMAWLMELALEGAAWSAVVVGLTGSPEADDVVLETARRCGVSVGGAGADVVAPTATRIVSVSDADEEVRQVVREIVQLVHDGTPLHRIAVFRPTPNSYARTVIEHLDGAGIPHNGPGAKRLADTVAGRTLLRALALPREHWGRGALIDLVAEAPVRAAGELASPRQWDAISRKAGVVGGLDGWRSKLAAHAAVLEATLRAVADDDASAGAVPRRIAAERELATTARMATFVEAVATSLASLDAASTWTARSQVARSMLVDLLGSEQRRVQWPDDEATAAARVDEALVRLGSLDDLEGNPSRTTFELAVAAELDAPVGRVGRFGHGVLVAPLTTSPGYDLDAVFVLGMAEGTCPAARRERAMLPDGDRVLAELGELETSDDQLRTQQRAYLAALAAGRSVRVLLWPRGNLRGRRARLASRWLLDSASALAGRRIYSSDVAALPDDVLHVVASYADGVATAATHGSVEDRDVAMLLASPDPLGHPLATRDLGRGFEARSARAGSAFTRWDGNLAGHVMPSPATGTPMSASRLEMWAGCPFEYFLSSVLHLGERDDPERIVEIRAADRGTLVHAVLERFVGEILDEDRVPSPAQPWSDDDRRRVAAIAEEEFASVEARGLSGRPLHWRRTKGEVLADLDVFLTMDDAHRAAGGYRPVHVEMAFGLRGAEPLRLALADGRMLTFRGLVDRVDVDGSGHPVVLDYKTGGGTAYKGVEDGDPVKEGRLLQLGIYAEAARARLGADDVEARYWMISPKGEWAKPGYAWTDERRERFLSVTSAIVDGIESGLFPARPGEYDPFWRSHDNCRFCDFDRVCPRDREDHERATAGAPELALLGRLKVLAEEDAGGS
ncbi:MAG TPA: PD-(D/E)XK nuclease family protein [Acidimicrobiales bacterium]|nr:PD-(D/E)XK nuclease family protein [Acidimicrobiales bacterium]